MGEDTKNDYKKMTPGVRFKNYRILKLKILGANIGERMPCIGMILLSWLAMLW